MCASTRAYKATLILYAHFYSLSVKTSLRFNCQERNNWPPQQSPISITHYKYIAYTPVALCRKQSGRITTTSSRIRRTRNSTILPAGPERSPLPRVPRQTFSRTPLAYRQNYHYFPRKARQRQPPAQQNKLAQKHHRPHVLLPSLAAQDTGSTVPAITSPTHRSHIGGKFANEQLCKATTQSPVRCERAAR